jgi:hypothetical protein
MVPPPRIQWAWLLSLRPGDQVPPWGAYATSQKLRIG